MVKWMDWCWNRNTKIHTNVYDNCFAKHSVISSPDHTINAQTNTNTTKTYEANWLARLSMLSSSKFVVGSSRVNIPQFKQNVSAKANLIINDARNCSQKRWITDCYLFFCRANGSFPAHYPPEIMDRSEKVLLRIVGNKFVGKGIFSLGISSVKTNWPWGYLEDGS